MEFLLNTQTNFGILNLRSTAEKKIIEVGLVSTIRDSYKTVINPRGCITPLEGVPVDYNHNRISTGAKMFDKGFKEIEIPDGNGGFEKVEIRVVEVHVFKNSKMWTRENKDKKADEVPSLFEAVETGRIGWGSVDFEPIEENIEKIYNAKGDLIREEYKKWRLNFFSLLDTKPGQDTSYIYSIRMKKPNNILFFNNIRMYNTILEALKSKLKELEVKFKNISDLIQNHKSEADGILNFNVDQIPYTASYKTTDEAFTIETITEIKDQEDQEDQEDGEDREDKANQNNLPTEEDEKDEMDQNKRIGVSSILKSKDGKLALISKKVSEHISKGKKEVYTLLDLDTKEELTASGSDIGYQWEGEGNKEWTYAEIGDIVIKLFDLSTKPQKEEQEEDETKKEINGQDSIETDKLKEELKLERAKNRSLEEKFEKLLNSPKEDKKRSLDLATDLNTNQDSEDAEDQMEQTRQGILAQNITL